MRIGISQQRIAKAISELKKEQLFDLDFLINLQQETLGYQSLTTVFGVPIQPQLASSYTDVNQLVDDFVDQEGQYYCEFKYDGERLQIHYNDGEIQLFGRTMECKTLQYPVFVQNLRCHFESTQTKNIILDCELICYDKENGIVPFQEMQSIKTNSDGICAVCFDILMMNDQSLIELPLQERQLFYKNVMNPISQIQSTISYIESIPLAYQTINEDVSRLFNQALEQKLEGVMIKKNNRYRPASRTEWAKLKIEKELDLLLIGAFWGYGNRSKVFGSFLLGARQGESIVPVTKLGSGFSAIQLEQLTNQLYPIAQEKPQNFIQARNGIKPDVWFDGQEVWEVQYDSITESPRYQMENLIFKGGLSLRFPRFKRFRPDKTKEQSATVDEVFLLNN